MEGNMLKTKDFELLWRFDLREIAYRIDLRKFEYRLFTPNETDLEIDSILAHIRTGLNKSGPKRINDWENGWLENLENYRENQFIDSLTPKYFGKDPTLRFKNNFIFSQNYDLELNFFATLMDYISIRYLKGFEHVYEFGCGTFHNLIRIRSLFEKVNLTGLDWTTSSNQIGQKLFDKYQINNYEFDFYNPDFTLKVTDNSCALTVAALEQVGTKSKKFIDYLLLSNFRRVVHVEPIIELLNPKDRLESLSIKYSQERNYLEGLLPYLEKNEAEGKLKILTCEKSYIGSHYLDGYQIIVWENIK
jgi:hypothetical protein